MLFDSLEKASGLHQGGRDPVGIDVGSRATVFEVAEALSSDMARDTDGSTTVGDTRGEGANVAGLVPTGQPELVVLSVDGNVFHMPLGELLNGLFDGLHAALLTHGLGGVVGVAASTVPVAREGLGVEGDLDTPLFGNADEQETGHPEVVTHRDTLAGTDLELPLGGHDFGVDTRNVDTSIQACAVVSLDQITSKDLASSDTTVVGALRTGETTLWPLVWLVIGIKESVLLLETEPGFDLGALVKDLLGMVAVVGLVGGTIVVVGLCEDEDVVSTAEGVPKDGSWTKVDVRVVAGGLVGGGAIKVPNSEVREILHRLGDSSGLAAKSTVTIDPDVFGLDLASLVELKVALEEVWLVEICSGHCVRLGS